MSFDFMYMIAVYFFFILALGGSKYRIHSAIILFFTVLNIYFASPLSTNLDEYITNRAINIAWDGAAGVSLLVFLFMDKLASKQSLVLAFAILCHCMAIYDLTITSTIFSQFFYSYYDELIILVGLLQIGVSFNGFTTACNNALRKVQGFIFWPSYYIHYLCSSLLARKTREIKE